MSAYIGNGVTGFPVDSTNPRVIDGALLVSGNFTINLDKFTVAAATGNTVIAGTLSAGATTVTTLSASGKLSLTGGLALIQEWSGATTGANYAKALNTGGSLWYGIESSAGGTIFLGTTAYATVFGSNTNTPVQIASNNSVVGSFSSTGLAITGALSAGATSITTLATSGVITSTVNNGYAVKHTRTAAAFAGYGIGDGTYDVRLAIAADNSCYVGTISNHTFNVLSNGSIVGAFSSTGLAVTGTLSATGVLKSTNSYGVWVGSDVIGTEGGITTIGANPLIFGTDGTKRMTLSSTGNLSLTGSLTAAAGIEQYKNANSTSYVRVANDSVGTAADSYFYAQNSAYSLVMGLPSTGYTTSGIKVANTGYIFCDSTAGLNIGATHASGILKLFSGGTTERARFDASGQLGINCTPAAPFHITWATSGDIIRVQQNARYLNLGSYYVGVKGEEAQFGSQDNYRTMFFTNSTERAQFTSDGFFKASNFAAYYGSTYHEIRSNVSGSVSLVVSNNHATNPFGLMILTDGATINNGTNYFLRCEDATTTRLYVFTNGGIGNYQANNTNLSDLTVKPDFVLYSSTESLSLKAWNFGKRMINAWGRFKYDDQTHDDWNNGYGAQLVREAAGEDFPELVELAQWGDRQLLTVYDSDLMHIVGFNVTQLQFRSDEQAEKIKQLEAEVAELKAKLN